ncbi:pseudaminic acid cytidylyltransferase [Psychrobacter sp. HY3-MNA-CIBAN-0198]|uniref:pseudaminic acid cytidylyltransferase n=1 Tax=Psychrobacter sp. HY3-MNA-CIBAN-0198 TaxID=3140441 RepID=UPI00331E30CB
MIIAVIPARGGSKRIPRKNIKSFKGKPIIAWSIDIAKKTKIFDKIIVSTDDPEIAEIARLYGAEVPFIRPREISDDLSTTVPVISHAVSEMQNLGFKVDYACCLYPCSPFIDSKDLINGLDLLKKSSKSDYCYPVSEYVHPIQRALRRSNDGTLSFLMPKYELSRTQDLEQTFHDAGQFYWGNSQAWLENKNMHSGAIGLPIPNWRVVDIDTSDDWVRAEIMFELMNMNRN